jgi:hypothetical protein
MSLPRVKISCKKSLLPPYRQEPVVSAWTGEERFPDMNYEEFLPLKEHEETVSTLLEALKGSETFLEMYLEDCKESDARIAERDGYSDGYTSLHTQNVEQDLDAVRAAIAKAEA